MDTISVPARATAIDTGLSASTLRHRNNATDGHEPLVLDSASGPLRSHAHSLIQFL